MVIPDRIKSIAQIVRLLRVSCKRKTDSNGTNAYPNDSNIGKSFNSTPWLIA